MIRRHFHLAPVVLLIALGVSTLGCGGTSSTAGPQGSDLRGLVSLYTSATRQTGQPPRSEEELKQFATDQGPQLLERLKVDSVDAIFISPRDGQPYVVMYGPKNTSGVIAYEAQGVNGIRQVGDPTGRIRNMNEEQFAELGL